MVLQQFGDDFVLLLNLRFKGYDFSVFGIVLLERTTVFLKGNGGVIEQLLLPSVDLGWLQAEFITQVGNGNFVDQMPFDDRGFLFGGKRSS